MTQRETMELRKLAETLLGTEMVPEKVGETEWSRDMEVEVGVGEGVEMELEVVGLTVEMEVEAAEVLQEATTLLLMKAVGAGGAKRWMTMADHHQK